VTAVESIIDRACKRKLATWVLSPEGLMRNKNADDARYGYLVVVQDSTGPDAFDEATLKAMLTGAQSVLCSAEMDQSHAAMIGLMLDMAVAPRIVIIVTMPRHHAAWNRKVELLAGCGPLIHVVSDEATPEDWGSAQ